MCTFFMYITFSFVFQLHLCLLLLSTTLFLCELPMKSIKILRVSLHLLALLFICLRLLAWPFTFTEKSNCDNLNLVVSLSSIISIITIIVKLLEVIWVTLLVFWCVSVSACLFLHIWKVCISHHNGVVSLMYYSSRTWNSSCWRKLVKGGGWKVKKKKKFKGIPKFKWGPKDAYSREKTEFRGDL